MSRKKWCFIGDLRSFLYALLILWYWLRRLQVSLTTNQIRIVVWRSIKSSGWWRSLYGDCYCLLLFSILWSLLFVICYLLFVRCMPLLFFLSFGFHASLIDIFFSVFSRFIICRIFMNSLRCYASKILLIVLIMFLVWVVFLLFC